MQSGGQTEAVRCWQMRVANSEFTLKVCRRGAEPSTLACLAGYGHYQRCSLHDGDEAL